MTDQPDLRAAVAAGVVGSEASHRALLNAIVEVARSIFGAKASSILLLDEATEELVFEAVVGEGEDTLLGTRFPAGTGIAGWVLATRTPLVIEDVQSDPRFASDVAEGTGYDLHWDLKFDCLEKFEWEWAEEPKRFEWKRGDFIYVPPFTNHQHFAHEEARLIVISNRIVKDMGFDWFDQVEAAPGFEQQPGA